MPATNMTEQKVKHSEKMAELEQGIKKLLINAHQVITGKGPKDVFVKVIKNMVIIRTQGIFTHLEEQLLKNHPEGKELVSKIKETFYDCMPTESITKLEALLGSRITKVISDIIWEKAESYTVLVMSNQVEP